MTISTTDSSIRYNGNSVTLAFPVPYRFLLNGDISALLRSSAGVVTPLMEGTHYTLTGAGNDEGGTLTMLVAPAVGETLIIDRIVALTQETDYPEGGNFPAEAHERALDRLTMITQQQETSLGYCLALPDRETADPLPPVSERASRLLGFDALGRVFMYAASMLGSVAEFAVTLASSAGSSLIGFIQSGAGAVPRTLQDELRECVNVKQFGALGDGSNQYAQIALAWNHCIDVRKNLYFPPGVYSSGASNMPFKNPVFPASSLLDCGGITIFGDGPNTVLRSDSINGADVLNLYSVKNLHFRNLGITASLPFGATGSGSNGCSVVGGFDNVTLENIWCVDLPYVEKPSFLDGGKAVTIQPGTPATECGTFRARNIFANGCVYGFGLEVDLDNWATKKPCIDIDIVAEDCYRAVITSSPEADAPLPTAMAMGLRVRAQVVNGQHGVAVSRGHGVDIEAQFISNKTAAQKRLNPSGTAWRTTDSIVDALLCTYGKNSRLTMYGNCGDVDYKVQVGGAGSGGSGLLGTTDNCRFHIDLGGTAAINNFNVINSGGNSVVNSDFYVSSNTGVTLSTLPALLFTSTNMNTIAVGPSQRLVDVTILNPLKFAHTDGVNSFLQMKSVGFGMFAYQTGSSGGATQVLGVRNHLDATRFAVRNDGAVCSEASFPASSVSGVVAALPVYNSANVLIGYQPLYSTFTP